MKRVIKNVAKHCIVLFGILLITICAYAQAPEWEWATQAGGSGIGWDEGYGIAIDDFGNIYVTGTFCSVATFGPYSLTSSGSQDIFVAKIDANGNWQWATKAGGLDHDSGYEITIDDVGNSYVTGWFEGAAYFGPFSFTSCGYGDIFVAKIDSSGTWEWVVQAGGYADDRGYGIKIDTGGYCYVTGYFQHTASFGTYSLTASGIHGYSDIFVAKVDSNGSWEWATRAGGVYSDRGCGLTVDETGSSYVTGYFDEAATFGSSSLTSNGNRDIYVAKLDLGDNWLWAANAGSTDNDIGYGITIDDGVNSYVIGCFTGIATFGSSVLISSGYSDIFVAKIDTSGNWQWATKAGGIVYDSGYDITTDNAGNGYVTGGFYSTANFGSYSLTSSGDYDIFVGEIDSEGNWKWVTQAGGFLDDIGCSVQKDAADKILVTGYFEETAAFGSNSLISSGNEDIFVAKLNPPVSADPEINPYAGSFSNYPNPFNASTKINYNLIREAEVRLEIYNIKGQLVETLFDENIQAGDHTVEWDCQDMPSGMYFLKMKAGNEESIRKMILLR